MPLELFLSKALEIDQNMLIKIEFQSLHAISEKYFLEKMVFQGIKFEINHL